MHGRASCPGQESDAPQLGWQAQVAGRRGSRVKGEALLTPSRRAEGLSRDRHPWFHGSAPAPSQGRLIRARRLRPPPPGEPTEILEREIGAQPQNGAEKPHSTPICHIVVWRWYGKRRLKLLPWGRSARRTSPFASDSSIRASAPVLAGQSRIEILCSGLGPSSGRSFPIGSSRRCDSKISPSHRD